MKSRCDNGWKIRLGDDPAREAAIVETLLKRGLSGLVIAPITVEQSYLGAWVGNIPIVFVDHGPTKVAADSFTDDDFGGAHLAVTHLLEHGHRRNAFIGDGLSLPTTTGRLAGYRAALARPPGRAGRQPGAGGRVRPRQRRRGADRITAMENRPTALFSSNASCTMATIPVLKPFSFAVVGFGDFPMADALTPALTVIDQDPSAIGRLAAERILQRIEHPTRRFRRRTVLQVEFARARLLPAASRLTSGPLTQRA